MSKGRKLVYTVWFAAGVTLGLLLVRTWTTRTTPPPAAWPRIAAYELDVDLTEPARFRGSARVTFRSAPGGTLHFLLNRALTIHRAQVEGRVVEVSHLHPLAARFHREARVVRVTLDPPPEEGPVLLELDYRGDAEQGTQGSDWRGILYVGEEEARMSEQTVFYPQVPVDLEGPAIQIAPLRLTVVAPPHWEVFAPLPQGQVEPDVAGTRWHFTGDRPQVLSVLAGERRRRVARVGATEVVTLLRDEHADLADSIVTVSGAALERFAARFGAIDAGTLGVFEISCRSDSSYNWTSQGVLAIDRHALGREVPVKTLAHEVAHLWWGHAVSATGPGERFLIEGLAESSAWTFLADTGRNELVQRAISSAQRRIAALVEAGESAALERVGFGHEHYADLAYRKGALVLRLLRGQLPPGALDRALRQLITGSEGRPVTLDDFRRVLGEVTGRGELRVPWLEGSGDLELELAGVELDGREASGSAGSCRLTILVNPVTPRCTLDPRGTPVGVLLGGAGWSERHTVLLTDEVTRVRLPTGDRVVTHARLDPDGVWTRHLRAGTVVLDGARLVATDPPVGGLVPMGGQTIRLTFDRTLAPVELESLRAAQAGSGGAEGHALEILALEQTEGGRTLELRTPPWAPGRRYRLLLTHLVDPGGTPTAATAFGFQTRVSEDRTPPRVIASEPAPGATVPPGEIHVSVTFDEAMDRGQGFPGTAVRGNRRRGLEFPDFAGFGTWDEAHRTITWVIPQPGPGSTYCLPFTGSTFRDLSGNGAADFELIFTVAEEGDQGGDPPDQGDHQHGSRGVESDR